MAPCTTWSPGCIGGRAPNGCIPPLETQAPPAASPIDPALPRDHNPLRAQPLNPVPWAPRCSSQAPKQPVPASPRARGSAAAMLARSAAACIPAAPSSRTSRHAGDAKATIPSKARQPPGSTKLPFPSGSLHPRVQGRCGGPCRSPGIVGTRQTPRQSDPSLLRDPEPSALGRARAADEGREPFGNAHAGEQGHLPGGLPGPNWLRQPGPGSRNPIPTYCTGGWALKNFQQ